jgi:hypothetical protein
MKLEDDSQTKDMKTQNNELPTKPSFSKIEQSSDNFGSNDDNSDSPTDFYSNNIEMDYSEEPEMDYSDSEDLSSVDQKEMLNNKIIHQVLTKSINKKVIFSSRRGIF